MTAERSPEGPRPRRVPAQERSRVRVERILDATSQVVLERGVDALTTRDVARRAEVPVASLYQYFADKEDLLLALLERDTEEMDRQVALDLAALGPLTLESLVRTTMEAFVKVYHRRSAFVEVYLRGRTNVAVHAFGRRHNARIAATLRELAVETGLARPDMPLKAAILAVEVGDRVFQLAYEHDDTGDAELVEEGIVLVTAYLAKYVAA